MKLLQDLVAVLFLADFTKTGMLTVEPWGINESHEELAAVGVWTSICHGKLTSAFVLFQEVFILELHTIDGLATSAVSSCEVTTLCHKVRDHSVEWGTLVVEWLALLAHTLL